MSAHGKCVCGNEPTCIGRYEVCEGLFEFGCDTCCGHGNEDGRCVGIGDDDGVLTLINQLCASGERESAALAESDIRIAGVEAERDHYRVGLAESERCVSCVEAERDAYRAALEALVGAYAVRCQCTTCDSHREPAPLRAALALLAKGGKG